MSSEAHRPVIARVLGNSEVEGIRRGDLRLDCLQMQVRRRSSKNPRVFEGPGYISFGPDRKISFKIYDAEAAPDTAREVNAMLARPAGQFVPQEEFFSFSAVDMKRRKWQSPDVFPPLGGVPSLSSIPGRIVTGELQQITSEKQSEGSAYFRGVALDVDLKPPPLIYSYNSDYGTFTLREEGGKLTFQIDRDEVDFKERVAERALEALRFVLARPLNWSIEERRSRGKLEAKVYSRNLPQVSPRVQPPIQMNRAETHRWFWKLFDSYLRYSVDAPGKGFHPLSSVLSTIYRSSSSYIQSEALALSVGVEAVIKSEAVFEDFGEGGKGNEQLEAALKCLEESDLPAALEAVKPRLAGAIGNWLNPKPTPQRVLCEAVKRGIISNDQHEAWKKVRHQLAHGVDPMRNENTSIRDFIQQCDKLIMLVYWLIFYAIGYSGKYTDQSVAGWEVKEFKQGGRF